MEGDELNDCILMLMAAEKCFVLFLLIHVVFSRRAGRCSSPIARTRVEYDELMLKYVTRREFRKAFRMNKSSFNLLLRKLSPDLLPSPHRNYGINGRVLPFIKLTCYLRIVGLASIYYPSQHNVGSQPCVRP